MNLDELVAQLPARTAAPQRAAAGARVGDPRDIGNLVRSLREPVAPVVRPAARTASSRSQGSAAVPQEKQSFLGSIAGAVGNGLMEVLDVVDTPRAAVVAGLKEAQDAFGQTIDGDGEANWDDFWANTSRNAGSRELLIDQNKMNAGLPGWVKSVGGFAGDVAADPLTYLTLGTGTAAKGVGLHVDDAIAVALRNGGRREISETIAQSAARRGVSSPAVDRLVASAAQRGRGALTTQGLRAAGVTDDTARKLGLSVVDNATFGLGSKRATIPGTRQLAQGAENLKGQIKKSLGETAGASFVRGLRFSNDLSERAFIDTARRAGESVDTRATAVRASGKIARARSASGRYIHEQVLRLERDLPEIAKMDKAQLRQFTHDLEAGVVNDTTTKARNLLNDMHRELTEQGVEVSYRAGYIPHTLTKEGRKAVTQNKELSPFFVKSLNSKEALQFARRLNPGDDFLGTKLVTASIDEINGITNAKFGIDILDDDAATLLGNYVTQGASAIKRSVMMRELGGSVGKPMGTRMIRDKSDDAAASALEQSRRDVLTGEKDALVESNAIRMREAELGQEMIREAQGQVGRQLDDLDRELAAGSRKVRAATARREGLEQRLSGLEAAAAQWEGVAKRARGAERKAAQSRLRRINAKLAKVRSEATGAAKSAASTSARMETIAASLGKTRAEWQELSAAKDEVVERIAQTRGELGTGGLPEEVRFAQEQTRVRVANEGLAEATNEADVAANTLSFMHAELGAVIGKLESQLDEMNSVLTDLQSPPRFARGRRTKVALADQREWLRDRTATIRAVLENSNDPWTGELARLESQAAIADMQAWQLGNTAAKLDDMIKPLRDPKFMQMVNEQADAGWRKIAGDMQIPEWVAKEFDDQVQKLNDPKWWDGFLRTYDQFNNWWKAWAVTSPGFIVRNMYSGLFNMYLDRVDIIGAGRQWHKFYRLVEKHPTDYKAYALRAFNGDEALVQQLDDSYAAIAASGWGQAPEEVALKTVETRASYNPLRADNRITRLSRRANEQAETFMRGTHAFDVISRGGTLEQATERITKWHFNYRDITDFDRAAKRLMPFWTFYSRNMALQAQVWTRYPQRLNRSFFNFKRNVEANSEEEGIVPSYYEEGSFVRTPFSLGEGRAYLSMDLPSLRFSDDLAKATNPARILADAGPIPKLTAELIAGKKLYTDQPFMNTFSRTTETPWGTKARTPNEAPWIATLPGVKQMMEATGLVEEYADGTPVMTDRTQYVMETLAPPLARANRLAPNQDYLEQRKEASWLSFLGLGVRSNTPAAQNAEQRRREEILRELAATETDLGR